MKVKNRLFFNQTDSLKDKKVVLEQQQRYFSMNFVYLSDLPTDAYGRLSPSALARTLHIEHLMGRTHFTTYNGSRDGKHPIYSQETLTLSALFQEERAVVSNGGGNGGQMKNIMAHVPFSLCYTTALFALGDLEKSNGTTEGLKNRPNTIDIVVDDFMPRKPPMMAFSNVSFPGVGGLGTIEEATEDLSFSPERNRLVVFVGPNSYWDNLAAQFDVFLSCGLMPERYRKHFVFTQNAEAAMRTAKDFLTKRKEQNYAHTAPQNVKPRVSTRQYMIDNMKSVIGELKRLFEDRDFTGQDRPWIGLLASGNMGPDKSRFNVDDSSLREQIAKDAAKLGEDLGKKRAVTVISGTNEGLRKIVANGALKNGGKVVWVRKGHTDKPLSIAQKNNQEIVLTVPRHYEKDMLIATLAQGYVSIAGGIHTLDQVFGHMTRNQTGHGSFTTLFPDHYDPTAQRPKIALHNPQLPGGKGLWDSIMKQVAHGISEGFASERDHELMTVSGSAEGLADAAIADAAGRPDIFKLAENGPLLPAMTTVKICEMLGRPVRGFRCDL